MVLVVEGRKSESEEEPRKPPWLQATNVDKRLLQAGFRVLDRAAHLHNSGVLQSPSVYSAGLWSASIFYRAYACYAMDCEIIGQCQVAIGFFL